jgi:nitrite reductase/ring-hydroxylating ferredoxin subunit
MVRKGRDVRAFVNACPHQYLPLNHKGDKLISTDGKVIRCTNHSAGYSAETGEGIEGLGIGKCLDAIPVRVATDDIVVVA